MRLAAFASLLLAACGPLLGPQSTDDGEKGAARFQISLASPGSALGKAAAEARKNDTLTRVDTLFLTLTSPGSTTRNVKLPVSGNINAGPLTLNATVANLPSLRNWKVQARASDNLDSTVHLDSTTFYVKPGDTASVNMSLLPRFSVFIARFVSTSNAITAIEKLELRINGVTVDDTLFAPKKKIFDLKLSQKYFRVGVSATIALRALDRASPARVRYRRSFTYTAGASADSVFTVTLN